MGNLDYTVREESGNLDVEISVVLSHDGGLQGLTERFKVRRERLLGERLCN
jgi:hypothetical protein